MRKCEMRKNLHGIKYVTKKKANQCRLFIFQMAIILVVIV